jgi:hypothetical protein
MTDQPNNSVLSSGSEASGTVPAVSDGVGKVPQPAASFGNMPPPAEAFRKVPHAAARRENHTLTVREVVRQFEAAGVARSERTIVNWCQRDVQGVAKLDSYFDSNGRRYFITPESVERAIVEEQAKADRHSQAVGGETSLPKVVESRPTRTVGAEEPERVKEMELKMRDLEIATRVKDQVIEMKDKAIEQLQEQQRGYIERLIESGHRIGELETKLLQLAAPEPSASRRLEVRSEEVGGALPAE